MSQTQLTPAEQLKRDIASTQSELNQLVDKVKLTSVRDNYSTLDTDIGNLPMRVQKIRDRKYAFNRILESQVRNFQKQWAVKCNSIQNQITMESNMLQNLLPPLESRVRALSIGSSSTSTVKAVQSDLTSFKTKVSAAEHAVTEMFEGFKNEVSKVKAQLYLIEKHLI